MNKYTKCCSSGKVPQILTPTFLTNLKITVAMQLGQCYGSCEIHVTCHVTCGRVPVLGKPLLLWRPSVF